MEIVNGELLSVDIFDITNGKFTVPDGVYAITSTAFRDVRYCLYEVHLSNSVRLIKSRAFGKCNKLRVINLTDCLEKICAYAFHDCTSLETITIPGVKGLLERGVFQGCSKLKEVVILEGFDYIQGDTFTDCHSLERLYLPKSLESISSHAFDNCKSPWLCTRLTEESDDSDSLKKYSYTMCQSAEDTTVGTVDLTKAEADIVAYALDRNNWNITSQGYYSGYCSIDVDNPIEKVSDIPPGALEWCREYCPQVYWDLPDEKLWEMCKELYYNRFI